MKLQLKLIPLLLLLAGCPQNTGASVPPLERLYFPMGIAHVDVAGSTEGVLFVANANTNKRYATGSLVALPLDLIGLPSLGADAGAEVARLKDLKLVETQSVQIASFASEIAVQPISANEYRIYVPTRSEGMNAFQVAARIDGTTPSLSCVNATGQDCSGKGTSMTPTVFDGVDAGVQWPLTPFGITAANRTCGSTAECCATGSTTCARTCEAGRCLDASGVPFADVWVSYAPRSDAQSLLAGRALIGHLARLDSDDFTLKPESLIPMGPGGSNSVAVAGSWVYVTGRILNPAPNLLRLVNREGVVLATALESLFRVSDSRSITLSSDGQRLFIVGRVPDTLLVASITNANTVPALNFVRGIPLCDAPNDARVIPRAAGRGDLVAVTCTAAGSVVIYDDEVGDLVAQLPGVGAQPYGLAVDVRGNGARIFVSNHGDGRITVIDVPSLDRPQAARIVATLGETEVCLTQGENSPACRASKEGSQ